SKSALTFALHPRKPHDRFITALATATGAERGSITAGLQEASDAEKARQKAELKEYANSRPSASFGSASLRSGLLHYESKVIDMADATSEATLGTPSRRSTLTRMGAGALIAGPAGFIVGAVARK